MLFLPRTGWCSRDLSAVLNAVARFWPRACPTKQASGPALQPVSLACPPSVSLLLGTAPREVGTGLLTILGCASLSRAGTLAGGRRRGLGSLSGAGASPRAPSPAPGLCSSPCPVPPKCARGPRLEQAEKRGRGRRSGGRSAARRGHGRGVPCLRAAALQRPQAALPAAAGGVSRAQGGPRAVQG